jgi:PPOX class probable F420-dependent enzyme
MTPIPKNRHGDVARPEVVEVGRTQAAADPAFEFDETALNSFLDRQRNAILGTTQSDGSPQVTPAWYHWDGGVLRISSPNWTRKVRNIRRDPRISVCIDDQVSGTYATMFGRAELVEGTEVESETWPILIKYLHPDEASVRWRRINADGDRVVIRLQPRRIVWRHSVR